ncbi:MAG: ATP-binding protein [Bacteroidales bacterium]|nr:ATP-binding protein [Bacteroidales bacterium]
MYRKLIKELAQWKLRAKHNPLILQGARQVGKTWLLKEFGKVYYEDVCYLNFERTPHLSDVFEGELSPQKIVEQLSVFHRRKIDSQKCLLIFDEVQECPRALTSLKYFSEEAPEYDICCAGSLLGVALHKGTSFPVGKVDFLTLYPMDFEEFLMVYESEQLVQFLHHVQFDTNLNPYREKLESALKLYFIIGGMPGAVQKYLDTHDLELVNDVLYFILQTYQNDFSKHAEKRIVEKIRYVWNSLPSQLSKENKKFVYGLVREGARAREYEDAILWLKDTGLITAVHRITKPALPLSAYSDLSDFKIYALDVGLLRVLSGLSAQTIVNGNAVFEEFKGAFTEQFVLQELRTKHNNQIYYWTSGNSAEVDFIIANANNVIPIEVKATVSVQAKSLKVYNQKYAPQQMLRFSLLPPCVHDNLIDWPLYLLFTSKANYNFSNVL